MSKSRNHAIDAKRRKIHEGMARNGARKPLYERLEQSRKDKDFARLAKG